ncbi:hypothetical protein KGA66_21605 [Actinocrinis puniceicyclus]|uniref:Uncharacterized protein n=1 Tax=Actinocrinis puniceicyclus TaxID=977794 RepID=A0A8J8BD00_9ACTN|nr:hypothetical protein [Actinocrinis puniceicyclus]MBS2965662.1 hypothetical protein [Actinocrinis puniceicyclus]
MSSSYSRGSATFSVAVALLLIGFTAPPANASRPPDPPAPRGGASVSVDHCGASGVRLERAVDRRGFAAALAQVSRLLPGA